MLKTLFQNSRRPTSRYLEMTVILGRLKTRDWKTRDHQKCRGGKRGTGKHGTIIPGVENATSSYGKPKLQVYLVITNA